MDITNYNKHISTVSQKVANNIVDYCNLNVLTFRKELAKINLMGIHELVIKKISYTELFNGVGYKELENDNQIDILCFNACSLLEYKFRRYINLFNDIYEYYFLLRQRDKEHTILSLLKTGK